jgi:hypothetical protein
MAASAIHPAFQSSHFEISEYLYKDSGSENKAVHWGATKQLSGWIL